ncbi:MAG: phospho-N-acetylmuramoyl-pentapeptide-transferase [Candidatus Calescibacterium sp.]|nr:phospho-N-acetylmuramoyl-pentapeptide-transferase [Candidatus Calescibacterium sp.]MCX7971756.1 phospho-N-acetylmuramoyl-pentapeptide-transferase [bacterium]MDW8195362.1 phospho-N-acetylmuramoyl-pentapeptide-transferase [Candidatus Calescibacterium sp.]
MILILLILGIFCFFCYRFYIKLVKGRFVQYIREDAPKHHVFKEGTPTAGGVIFSLFILIYSLIVHAFYQIPLYILFVILFLGNFLIGLYDDIIKILNKRNLGLRAREKLFLHLLLTITIFFVMKINNQFFEQHFGISFSTLIFHTNLVDLGWIYFIFLYFLISGVSNATNLTDGLDGLLASLSITTLLGYLLVFILIYNVGMIYLILGIICFILVFLFFNFPRASIFMGDSGSMAIGSIFVYFSIISKTEPYLLFFGYIYFLVTLSVILQVIYFRLTKGRRIFSITPIHHHFETIGYDEKSILLRFNVANFVFIMVGLMFILYKYISRS